MHSVPMLQPSDLVWLPNLDAGAPEPPPPGWRRIRSVSLGRHVGPDDVHRTVVLETVTGFAPLTRRVHVHGDPDEGWDWGWLGSAPLDTALNILLHFVHPKSAWRLQWAFCECILRALPARGGVIQGDEIRAWVRRNAWVGKQRSWEAQAETAREAVLIRHRHESRDLSPDVRARRIAVLITRAAGEIPGRGQPGHPPPLDDGREYERAAAMLDATPPEQRWATLALLAAELRAACRAVRESWSRSASPVTPGLPSPEAASEIAATWSCLVGKTPADRTRVLVAAIHAAALASAGSWQGIPLLACTLGGSDRGDRCLAGDPVVAVATLQSLASEFEADPALRTAGAQLGLTPEAIAECRVRAHDLHVDDLREVRRSAEQTAAAESQRVQAAYTTRLPRGRSQRPPPTSATLRRWAVGAPLPLLREQARLARTPGGPLALRSVLLACGMVFPDPPGTVAAALCWYLEERDPSILDPGVFPIRGDGLLPAPTARAGATRQPPLHLPSRSP